MLVIRKEQMEAFSDAMRQRFIDRVAAHLEEVFPDKLETLNEKQPDATGNTVRDLIARLIESASVHAIVSERDVARYIDLAVEFGEGFETDRKMLWAAKILANKRLSGTARVALIYEQLPFKAPESRLVQS